MNYDNNQWLFQTEEKEHQEELLVGGEMKSDISVHSHITFCTNLPVDSELQLNNFGALPEYFHDIQKKHEYLYLKHILNM